MDPITTAIVTTVTGSLTREFFQESYNALKSALKKKFGAESDLVDAVNKLEKTPDRADRQATVQAEVEIAKANDDSELVGLAQELLSELKQQPDGQQVINQTVSHVKYAATSGTGDATISHITEDRGFKDN